MKLTNEEHDLVEKNHRLISWYIKRKGLKYDDWYGILSVELCLTVQKWNPEKGKLGHFYKIRADNCVHNEYVKKNSQKRGNDETCSLELLQEYVGNDTTEDAVLIEELLNSKYGHILKLKLEGNNQSEIAEKLGLTQSYISQIIRKVKVEYDIE
jgi:RNA polymerase sigma factor (sigma-70 family)